MESELTIYATREEMNAFFEKDDEEIGAFVKFCELIRPMDGDINAYKVIMRHSDGRGGKIPASCHTISALEKQCKKRVREYHIISSVWQNMDSVRWTGEDTQKEIGNTLVDYLCKHDRDADLFCSFEAPHADNDRMIDLLCQVDKEYAHSEPDCPIETNVEFAVKRCIERSKVREEMK